MFDTSNYLNFWYLIIFFFLKIILIYLVYWKKWQLKTILWLSSIRFRYYEDNELVLDIVHDLAQFFEQYT